MSTKKLATAASQEVVGLLLPEDLVEAAVGALRDGCDSPTLRMSAGLTAPETDEARAMFDRVLDELNIRRPSKRDAVIHLSRETAEKIVSGSKPPYEGAKQIWALTLLLPGEDLSELDSFVYGASEWEERPEDRRAFEDGIMAAARELVSVR